MPISYPETPGTIGEHIRKRRMDLGMYQSEVGRRFGVSKDCVTNWENNRNKPMIGHYPKIIAFLGYNPNAIDETNLGNRVFNFRLANGMSAKRFGKLIGIDSCTVLKLEADKCIPLRKTLRKINQIFSENGQQTI